ncbi:Sulfite exporter TauE/SafE [compost metagenome]
MNALKQAVSLSISIAAGVFFVFSGQIIWPVAAIMATGALAGGTLGGTLATRINPTLLRRIVVGIGVVVAGIYMIT